MKQLIVASACAAALLAGALAGAAVTVVPAAQPPAVSTGPLTSPSQPPQAAAPAVPAQPSAPAVTPGQHVGRWHQACDADVNRYCAGITSKRAVTACLDRNTDKLSPECKAIRGQEEQRWRSEHHRR